MPCHEAPPWDKGEGRKIGAALSPHSGLQPSVCLRKLAKLAAGVLGFFVWCGHISLLGPVASSAQQVHTVTELIELMKESQAQRDSS